MVMHTRGEGESECESHLVRAPSCRSEYSTVSHQRSPANHVYHDHVFQDCESTPRPRRSPCLHTLERSLTVHHPTGGPDLIALANRRKHPRVCLATHTQEHRELVLSVETLQTATQGCGTTDQTPQSAKRRVEAACHRQSQVVEYEVSPLTR